MTMPEEVSDEHLLKVIDDVSLARFATGCKSINNKFYCRLREKAISRLLNAAFVVRSETAFEAARVKATEDTNSDDGLGILSVKATEDTKSVIRVTQGLDDEERATITFTHKTEKLDGTPLARRRSGLRIFQASCKLEVSAGAFEVFHTERKTSYQLSYHTTPEQKQAFQEAVEKDKNKGVYVQSCFHIAPTVFSAKVTQESSVAFPELAFLGLGDAEITFSPRRPANQMGGSVVTLATKKSPVVNMPVAIAEAVMNEMVYAEITIPSSFGTARIDGWVPAFRCSKALAAEAIKESCGVTFAPRGQGCLSGSTTYKPLGVGGEYPFNATSVTVTLPKERPPFTAVGNSSVWRFGS